jgi:TPR repeat protein
MKKSGNLNATLFSITLLTAAFPLRAMHRGGAEEHGAEASLPSGPVASQDTVENERNRQKPPQPDIHSLIAKAQQGDAKTQCHLGLMYHKGQGVPQDFSEAARWLTKAAEQGHAKAQCNMGLIHHQGRNFSEAARWFTKAAEQGDARSQHYLG